MGRGTSEQNRPHGPWFGWLFAGAGGVVFLFGGVLGMFEGGRLGPLLVGALFAGAGAVVVVTDRRSHGQAVAPDTTRAALVEAGWTDLTTEVQADPDGRLPRPVVEALRIDRATSASGYDAVAELAGIHPSHVHAAGARTTSVGEVRVAEAWAVTSSSSTNGRVTGGTVEPRAVAWLPIPADIGRVTIRPDSARMKLADLVGVRPDHQVDWEAVDETWHLHGDDEPLLRAVVDIGLMGRLTELPGRWIVRFDGPWLLVVATADGDRLTSKPPTLVEVVDQIADVAVAVRSILPEMLWRDLPTFLAAYRG